jgi:predicted 3-demethylubiquinone-9 3-methyltransferase (glyoxalase superfamily)
MQKIVPNLWFDTEALEAAEFYVSLFEDSKIIDVVNYGEAGPGEPGTVMVVNFQLLGQDYVAINGGPQFPFTEAVSFEVRCDDQAEIDRLWEALTADGGQEVQCGWLKDKYGLSWQIVPTRWVELVTDPDQAKVEAAMRAMLEMKKLDIAELERAYAAG